MAKKFKLTSFENTSILRKFTILYFVMSVLPVGVLYYFYLQLRNLGTITISEVQFFWLMIFIVFGIAVGFFSVRTILLNLVEVTSKNTDALIEILGPRKAEELRETDVNEVALLAKSFNEITLHLEENVRNLELAKRTLQSVLSRIGEGISSMENIDSFLDLILETVVEAIDSKSGFLFLHNDDGQTFFLKTFFGKDVSPGQYKSVGVEEEGLLSLVAREKRTVLIERISRTDPLANILEEPTLCAPLILHEEVLGFVVVCGRKSQTPFTADEEGLLFNIALQTAVAVENSKLNENAERTYFETISALALAVEAKDPYSRGHLDRVADLCTRIAHEMGLDKQAIMLLRDAAKLHDIGKIGVLDKILTKKGPLDRDEMAMMKKHPEIGESIIKPIASLRDLCDIIRHHHEKLDGSGYPDGLKNGAISLPTRILTIADIYDAMTSERPYRISYTPTKAVAHLRSLKEELDQQVVDALERVI
ncbi:MAG TPA: HD domain-containing protein [Candidatus Omnitrophota bacterium]|nr:HD domain-containing protein [Candidatus Omnitrophota bacterium]